ncbi:DUF4126 domain-containing protein [Iamia sp. SCSIO 61187]|uniref:DUF4126 domain-containing protein n=1 Tax=Iamia sp. SCSIO 61187 TaxID=2722752 RepID=UPI001C63B7F0|nr:DUF4126 domain-containing protein [Iamia sp. SCSIO 61187]QYG92634.1 DUF4126 domain-containing protein [Iamia sp. SCSIO 61187]
MDVGTAALGAWSSGISMYFVAAVLGIAGRLDWVDSPEWLREPWVIGVAVVLFVVELVVDKVPWLDSTWDAVHTALRPTAGAILLAGAEATAGEARQQLWMGLGGAGLALSAHLAKASLRAVVNLSPEPVSNLVVSLGEDGLVAALMGLAVAFPRAALVVACALAAACSVTTVLLVRTLRRTRQRWRDRRRDQLVRRRARRSATG